MKLLVKIREIPTRLHILFYTLWNLCRFKIKCIKIGNNPKLYNHIYIKKHKKSEIIIGENFVFTSGGCINPLCRNIKGSLVTSPNAKIIIGNNVGMSSPCIWAHDKITIGDNVKIGGDCIIMDSDAHSLNYIDRRNYIIDNNNKKNRSIIIEDDVLIGTRCIILKGVTIGARSVIGSGSVVTKSIPSDCIAAGNPCKVIKYL